MSGLIDAIEDEHWRDWAKRLPEPAHPDPSATAVYLASLERSLEDSPRRADRLSPTARLTLIALLNRHLAQIAYELRRETRLAENVALARAVGPVADLLRAAGLVSGEARVAGQVARGLAGRTRAKHKADMRAREALGARCERLIDLLIAGLLQ